MKIVQLAKKVQTYLGITEIKWLRRPSGLYCFNYHRVGDKYSTPFDSATFSCDAKHFKEHLKFFKDHFNIIKPSTAIKFKSKPCDDRYAIITFDDGYIDNYEIAYPILRDLKVPAVFFLPTLYIGNDIIPWWDEIAWMLRNTAKKQINVGNTLINLPQKRNIIENETRKVLHFVKNNLELSIDEKINIIREQTECNINDLAEKPSLFVNWDQVREMHENGIEMGGHTHSHPVLSLLNVQEQRHEITTGKSILENKLGAKIKLFAYPVGGDNNFTEDTVQILKDTGFELGFKFTPGINKDFSLNAYKLNRFSIDLYHSTFRRIKQQVVASS